ELLDGALSHDQISRFLGQSLFTQQDYWKCVKPLVRKVEQEQGVIKIDDTILEKPHSTENDIVCWHWNHSRKPQAGLVKGVNILNFLYQSPLDKVQSISIPVAFEIVKKTEPYFDTKSGKVKKRSPQTKNAMVRERLRTLHHINKVKFRYVLWDIWFSSDDNFEFVHYELKKCFVAAIKNNRLAALSMEDKLAGKFHSVKELEAQKDEAITVWLKGLDFPVMLCKQVFTNKDGSTGELYLVTNDLELSAQAISATYEER
ncbi:MAG: IS701 family transposase, partial [Bacteroidota bacterium]